MLEDFQRYWHGDQEQLRLLLDHAPEPGRAPRISGAAAGSIGFHVLLIVFALNAPSGWSGRERINDARIQFGRPTPLVAPPDLREFRLTQKEAQRSKPVTEVDMAALLSRPQVVQPIQAPAGKVFVPPQAPSVTQQQVPVIEVPKQETAPQGLPDASAALAARLPTAPPPEQPKMANPFEKVGGTQGLPSGGRGVGMAAVAPPKTSVDEAVRAVTRGGGGRGLTVGDVGAGGGGGISEGVVQNQSQQRNASALELLSDPQGTDFRPYLIQVLAAVKRNWQSVFPESARFGRQGRVAIQFSIDRTGHVPKLVIAVPSGAEALDRAAVAGISASNPFPPLPNEFRGPEIRLQLVFSYNLPR
ncbi:MAG: TonB family protein [Acidobacteria bacterium]|nr:TonB family protein [Acidobacteriota bacterium]